MINGCSNVYVEGIEKLFINDFEIKKFYISNEKKEIKIPLELLNKKIIADFLNKDIFLKVKIVFLDNESMIMEKQSRTVKQGNNEIIIRFFDFDFRPMGPKILPPSMCYEKKAINILILAQGNLYYKAGENYIKSIMPYIEEDQSLWFFIEFKDGHAERVNSKFVEIVGY